MGAARKAKAQASALKRRPMPPEDLDPNGEFRPAPDLQTWVFDTFITPGAPLWNGDHAHLERAQIGFLWTTADNSRHMRRIVGQCERGKPMAMGKWAKARAEWQLRQWFGSEPDFVITLDASYCADASDIDFCALVEHELYHAAVERDEYGHPVFTQEGEYKFAIKGHDVEEHVGVVKRYGSTSEAMREMVSAILAGPEIAPVRIAQACGTCHLKAV